MGKSRLVTSDELSRAPTSAPAGRSEGQAQDTLGNDFIQSQVVAGSQDPAIANASGSSAGPPPACVGPADDALALRIAADLMSGGSWWSTQTVPACHESPIFRLRRCVGPATAPDGDDVQGAEALVEMDQARAELAAAAAALDPAWLSDWYEPAVAGLRRRLMTEAAMNAVDAAGRGNAATDPGAAVAAIDDTADSMERMADFVTVKSLKWGRKLGTTIVKAEEVSVSLPNPKTGQMEVVATHTKLLEWLGFAKVFLMAANSGGKIDDAFGEPIETGGVVGTLGEIAGRTAIVVEGVAGVVGAAATLGYGALLLAAKEYPEIAQACTLHAELCKKLSAAVSASKGLTGLLAALSIVKNAAVLIDRDSDFEQRLDASVAIATGAAKLGEALTGGAVAGFTAAAIAIPAGYAVWKRAMKEMGRTRIGVTGFLMAEELEDLLVYADRVVSAYNRVAVARQIAATTDDPEWADAYEQAGEAFASDVVPPCDALHAVSRGWYASVLRGGVDEVYELHKQASSGNGTPQEVAAFVADLAEKVSWILGNLPELIGLESGVEAPREEAASTTSHGGRLGTSVEP